MSLGRIHRFLPLLGLGDPRPCPPGDHRGGERQIEKGSSFAYVNEVALELAEELGRAIPCAEKIRFAASGTEATFYASDSPGPYTGRAKVLKFEGAYHGAHDVGCHESLFPRSSCLTLPPSPLRRGLEQAEGRGPDRSLQRSWNDTEDHRPPRRGSGLCDHGAAPAMYATGGGLPGRHPETPQREKDVLLVFDEVVTGFRLAYGGGQEYYGVTPDLAAFGKAMGGGYPIGAICGRADILDLCTEAMLGEERYVWFASTLAGNPVSAAASLATLGEFENRGLTNGSMVLERD